MLDETMLDETLTRPDRRGAPSARLREMIAAEIARHGPREVARDALVLIAETTLRTDPRLDPDHVQGEAGLQAAVREAVSGLRRKHPSLFEEAGGPSRAARPPVLDGVAVEVGRPPETAPSRPSAQPPSPAPPPRRTARARVRPSYLVYGLVAAALASAGALLAGAPGEPPREEARPAGRVPEDRRAEGGSAAPGARPVRDPETTGSVARGEDVVFPEQREPLRGVADVLDGATLRLEGRAVRLFGVERPRGGRGEDLARYLRRREVECDPTVAADVYRCTVDRYDLSEVILFNGGGKALPEASPDLKAAEAHARENRLGVWRQP